MSWSLEIVVFGCLQQFSFDEPGIDVSFDERRLIEDLSEQWDGGVDAIDVKHRPEILALEVLHDAEFGPYRKRMALDYEWAQWLQSLGTKKFLAPSPSR